MVAVEDVGAVRLPADLGEVLERAEPGPAQERVEPGLVGLGEEGVAEVLQVDRLERFPEQVFPKVLRSVEGEDPAVIREREDALLRFVVALDVVDRKGAGVLDEEVGERLLDVLKDPDSIEPDAQVELDVVPEERRRVVADHLAEFVGVVEHRPDRGIAEGPLAAVECRVGDRRLHDSGGGTGRSDQRGRNGERLGDLSVEIGVPQLLADRLPFGAGIVSCPDEVDKQRHRVQRDRVADAAVGWNAAVEGQTQGGQHLALGRQRSDTGRRRSPRRLALVVPVAQRLVAGSLIDEAGNRQAVRHVIEEQAGAIVDLGDESGQSATQRMPGHADTGAAQVCTRSGRRDIQIERKRALSRGRSEEHAPAVDDVTHQRRAEEARIEPQARVGPAVGDRDAGADRGAAGLVGDAVETLVLPRRIGRRIEAEIVGPGQDRRIADLMAGQVYDLVVFPVVDIHGQDGEIQVVPHGHVRTPPPGVVRIRKDQAMAQGGGVGPPIRPLRPLPTRQRARPAPVKGAVCRCIRQHSEW